MPGSLLFAQTPVDASFLPDILPAMVLIGLGAGLGFPTIMTLAMSDATPADAGLASGLLNTSVQVGGALGLAVLAVLASERTDGLRAAGEPVAAALNGGYHLAYLIGAALLGVALLVTLVVIRPAGARRRERVRVEPCPEAA